MAESTTYRRASSRRMTAGVARWFRSFAVRSLHWQLRLFPRFPTAGNIPKLIETMRLQNARGDAGPVTAAAINRRGFLAIKLSHPVAKLRDEDMSGARNVPLLPFTRRTHIDDLQRRLPLVQFVHTHLPDSFQRKPSRIPCFHSAGQITSEFRIACAREQSHRPLKIIVALEHQENRLIRVEQPTCPDRQNRRTA